MGKRAARQQVEDENKLDFERQAGGNAPRFKATRWDSDYKVERKVSGAGGGRCLAEEPNQGSEVGPDVGEEDEGFATGFTIDGKAFEIPALEGGVATLGGVAGAVVEPLPSWRAEGDVADEATGSVVFEREGNVENLAVVRIKVEVGAVSG